MLQVLCIGLPIAILHHKDLTLLSFDHTGSAIVGTLLKLYTSFHTCCTSPHQLSYRSGSWRHFVGRCLLFRVPAQEALTNQMRHMLWISPLIATISVLIGITGGIT